MRVNSKHKKEVKNMGEDDKKKTGVNGEAGEGSVQKPEGETQEETIAKLLKENAELKTRGGRDRAALEKANREKGELTKQLREKLTEQEKAEEAAKEAEEQRANYIKALERENNKNRAIKRYMAIGMSEEMADETADFELDGDMDGVIANCKKHQDAVVKEKQDEFIKSRPQPHTGNGEPACPITLAQFQRMSYKRKIEFKATYPAKFKEYMDKK